MTDFEFTFAFQPIANMRTREIYAYEALVRGPLGESAREVLARVNDSNRFLFDRASRVRALTLAQRLGNTKRTSVNLLPSAIENPKACLQTTLSVATSAGIAIENILFEINGAEPGANHCLAEAIHEHKRFGFATAIDDFGLGEGSVALLADFQPNFVKLDMNLIRNVESDPHRGAVVREIVDLCRERAIGVMAAGIETVDEFRWLLEAGVALFQGYFFAPPVFEALPFIDFDRCLERPQFFRGATFALEPASKVLHCSFGG